MDIPDSIKNRIRNAALATLAFAAFLGCAAVSNPDGGAYDETPPRVIGSNPDMESTDFKGKRITIDFNEFIKLENAAEKVIISPPQQQQPEIKVSGKKIQVDLFDSLKTNTTYTIDFSDGIVDNNEGNPLGNFCFRFSTGPSIDTLEVSGYVLNATDLEPVKGITVGLHSDLSDSAFTTKPFDRVSRTDGDGYFVIRGLAPGRYRVYAVQDMDQTFTYSQRSEKIAWMDSVIIPSSEMRIRQDTIKRNNDTDTILSVPYTRFMPDDITLLAFQPTPVIQYMSNYDRSTHEKFTLTFALPLDSMPVIKGLNFDETDAYVVQHTARYDSIVFWMKDSTVYYNDTLRLSVSFLASDTTGMLVPFTDTINLIPKKSREAILRDEARRAENDAKELDRQIKRLERANDSIGLLKLMEPKRVFLRANLTNGSHSVDKQITLTFTEPVTFLSDTAIHLHKKMDSLWVEEPFQIEQDTLDILKYFIYAEWRPEETFRITIDSASVQGLYGLHNDHIVSTLKFNPLNMYSTLTVHVQNPRPSFVVLLFDSGGKIVKTARLENGAADFFLLNPGTYYVGLLDDFNGNGVWDTGDYEEQRQPEQVYYLNYKFQLKQDWYHETEPWNIKEIPRFRQKPEELIKQKSNKTTIDIRRKNIEREEKKAAQTAKEREQRAERREKRRTLFRK